DDEKTLDELRARIQKTIDYVRTFSPAKLEGSETREITIPRPDGALTVNGETFLKRLSLPNFLFHCTMTYALLRQGGVELGKMDFLGKP
ncbi:MAG TPA: DUF1993 family protein, partial [Myxococcota bacterium]|nr:DUF1993 family protein [Myxococcota bacterium]